tara:strand:+ start:1387 stop:1611 length:225 start_codon:yes stop_codon:yes gene_type:complete
MPEQQTLKFTIRQDGLVTEEVFGAIGAECLNLTKSIEEKLGEVTYIERKPEYYKQENVTLQHNQNEDQKQTTTP